MNAHAKEFPRNYVDNSHAIPRGWQVRSDRPTAQECGYGPHSVVTKPVATESLINLIGGLKSDPEFLVRTYETREGREDQFFESSLPVRKVIQSIRVNPPSTAAVEEILDGLFEELKIGETFENEGIVMALLFALKRAGSNDVFADLATVFAGIRAAELARLSRYARDLLLR